MRSLKSFTKDYAFMTIATLGFFCLTSYTGETVLAASSRNYQAASKDSWSVPGPITSIKINLLSGELKVTPSTDGKLSIEAKGRLPMDAEKDARILKVETTGTEVFIADGKDVNDLSIQVKVPQGLESLSMGGTSGGASVANLKGVNLIFKSVSGALDAESIEFNKIHASTVSGEIEASLTNAPSGHFESVSGDVELKLPPAKKIKFNLKTVSGSIKNSYPSSEGSGDEIAVKTTSGDIEIK